MVAAKASDRGRLERKLALEVETVLLESPDVEDAVVFKEKNPIMGQIVCANIHRTDTAGTPAEVRARIKAFCTARLDDFKVPVKMTFTDEPLHSDRMKRLHIQPPSTDGQMRYSPCAQ